jgi:hypothetical protein
MIAASNPFVERRPDPDGVILYQSHPERSQPFAREWLVKSKDPYSLTPFALLLEHVGGYLGRISGSATVKGAGVLRLRGRFAMRSHYSAQDDRV